MAISSAVGLTGDSIGIIFLPDDDEAPIDDGTLEGFAIFGTNGRTPLYPLTLSMFVPILLYNGTSSSINLSMSPLMIKMVDDHEDSSQ